MPSPDWDAPERFFAQHADAPTVLDDDQRWSTWDQTAHALDRGPQPRPEWVVRHSAALDTELGILKTGKEADASATAGRSAPGSPRTARRRIRSGGWPRRCGRRAWGEAQMQVSA